MTEFDEIYSRLGKHERALVGEYLDRINQKLAKRDALADYLIGLLEPRIRKIIQEEMNANSNPL